MFVIIINAWHHFRPPNIALRLESEPHNIKLFRRKKLFESATSGKCTRRRTSVCLYKKEATLVNHLHFLPFPIPCLNNNTRCESRAQVLGNIETKKRKEEIQLRVHPINDDECIEPEPSSGVLIALRRTFTKSFFILRCENNFCKNCEAMLNICRNFPSDFWDHFDENYFNSPSRVERIEPGSYQKGIIKCIWIRRNTTRRRTTSEPSSRHAR